MGKIRNIDRATNRELEAYLDRLGWTEREITPVLANAIDEFADAHGMSRNAAINLLSKTGLREL